MWDYILDQDQCPIEHYKPYAEVNVLEKISTSHLIGRTSQKYRFRIDFLRSPSFHDQIVSHEIVTLLGLYPALDTPFIADGVGYAGAIVMVDL